MKELLSTKLLLSMATGLAAGFAIAIATEDKWTMFMLILALFIGHDWGTASAKSANSTKSYFSVLFGEMVWSVGIAAVVYVIWFGV